MKFADLVRLIVLAAIWGASFIFIRVLAPEFGPVMTACLRVLIAGVVLLGYFQVTGFSVDWKKHWLHYIVIGLVNSAVPFMLYGYAALHIPASVSVILNSTSPLFGLVMGALFLAEPFSVKKVVGLILGTVGVGLVAYKSEVAMGDEELGAILACLGAALCYAMAGTYIKRRAKGVKPVAVAGASQFVAGLALVPFAWGHPWPSDLTFGLIFSLLCLSLVCSAVAYLLYYRLVADVGPSRALTVTFLMPVFGMLWSHWFLGETITGPMLGGCAAILLGTGLVLKKS